MSNIVKLPEDLLISIAHFISPLDALALRSTSKVFRKLLQIEFIPARIGCICTICDKLCPRLRLKKYYSEDYILSIVQYFQMFLHLFSEMLQIYVQDRNIMQMYKIARKNTIWYSM
jgi:hypothetical protein